MSDVRPPTSMSHEPPDGGGDAYLWDRSGPVDAGVREVEEAARGLRHAGEWRGVEAKSHGMRMAKVRALAAAAVVVLAVVGAWVIWPSGRITRDSGERSPWKFVAGPRVTVTRTPEDKAEGAVPVVTLATDAVSTVVLTSKGGARIELMPNSTVEFSESVDWWVTRYPGQPDGELRLQRGGVVASTGANEMWPLIKAHGVHFSLEPNSAARIVLVASGRVELITDRGEAALDAQWSKSRTQMRLLPGMRVVAAPSGEGTTPLIEGASKRFVAVVERWRARGGTTTTQDVAEAADVQDAATLWNLAFEMMFSETDREPLIAAIGRLTGEWPAVIKTTKEPPWSETFKDAWWDVVKRSYEKRVKKDEPPTEPVPPPPGDGELKAPPVGKGGKK